MQTLMSPKVNNNLFVSLLHESYIYMHDIHFKLLAVCFNDIATPCINSKHLEPYANEQNMQSG